MEGANKKYSVIISEKAADMLIQHMRFLVEVNIEAAEKLREEMIEASKSLQYFPERNPRLSDKALTGNKYRKMIISKRYLLIYQIRDGTVYIEYILDCRQDYRWLL